MEINIYFIEFILIDNLGDRKKLKLKRKGKTTKSALLYVIKHYIFNFEIVEIKIYNKV